MELRKIESKMSKRGQFGLDSVRPVATTLIGVGLVLLIAILVFSTIDSSSLFTAGSLGANASSNLLANYSAGVDNFVDNIPTIFLVLGILVVILVLVVLVRSVSGRQFGGSA